MQGVSHVIIQVGTHYRHRAAGTAPDDLTIGSQTRGRIQSLAIGDFNSLPPTVCKSSNLNRTLKKIENIRNVDFASPLIFFVPLAFDHQ